MPNVLLIYYSRTGNTEKMAKRVVEGIKGVKGVEVNMIIDFEAKPEELAQADAIVVGMPTYHHDMTRSIKKLWEEAAVKEMDLKGKLGACFGSYGWSGEAPRLILEIMEKRYQMEVLKPPLLIQYAPDEKGLSDCLALGERVAEHVLKSVNTR